MPIFAQDDMDTQQLPGTGYSFSAKRIDQLGATEYTLVGIAGDRSGSVSGFQKELEACVKEVVQACRHSPRADNLMLRFTTFDSQLTEVHGFRPLSECDVAKYDGTFNPGGMTALYDATVNALSAITLYGESLSKQDYDCNAIVFVLTDGADNMSKMTPAEIKKAIQAAVKGESLESLLTILVGVNVQEPQVAAYLTKLKTDAGFDQYVELQDATQKTLAKLAKFVSQSISSQSQALGTGGPSQTLSI